VVDDARDAFAKAVERGAIPVQEPTVLLDDNGEIVIAAFQIYGETVHSLVERKKLHWPLHAGFCAGHAALRAGASRAQVRRPLRRQRRAGQDELLGRFLCQRDGVPESPHLRRQDDQYGVFVADVQGDGEWQRSHQVPINEPASGKRKSQIDEYLDFYHGPGVQHMALATDDIISTVTTLRDRAWNSEHPHDLLPGIAESPRRDRRARRRTGTARDPRGPRSGRLPPADIHEACRGSADVFYEIIQRKGAKSFGAGNFKALFEAIEREQGLRGKPVNEVASHMRKTVSHSPRLRRHPGDRRADIQQ